MEVPGYAELAVDEGEIGVLARNRVTLNDLNILEFIITCVFKHPPLVDQQGIQPVSPITWRRARISFTWSSCVSFSNTSEQVRCPHACRGRTSPREPKDKGLPNPSHVDLEGGAEVETQVVSANPFQIGSGRFAQDPWQ